mmetsp:Transcript_74037/g.128479  ORF Transcript_74037/g.128479 Transcript_74037/m.128479 type:complete len:104 (-) Transcript_74037:99-410(-)
MNRQYSTESQKSEPVGTFVGLICGESTMDLHYDMPEEIGASWTSRAGTSVQEGAFRNLVCADTSYDLHLTGEAPTVVRRKTAIASKVQAKDFECTQSELLLSV